MLEELARFNHKEQVVMRWSDLDELRHVNNAVYLTYFEQGRIEYFVKVGWDWQQTGMIQARAEIDYLSPLYLKDNPYIYIRTTRVGNKSFEVEHWIVDEKPEGNRLIAKGKTILVAYDIKKQQSVPIPEEEKARLRRFEQAELK